MRNHVIANAAEDRVIPGTPIDRVVAQSFASLIP